MFHSPVQSPNWSNTQDPVPGREPTLHHPKEPFESLANPLDIVKLLLADEDEFVKVHPIDAYVKSQHMSLDFRTAFEYMSDNVVDFLTLLKEPAIQSLMISGELNDHLRNVVDGRPFKVDVPPLEPERSPSPSRKRKLSTSGLSTTKR